MHIPKYWRERENRYRLTGTKKDKEITFPDKPDVTQGQIERYDFSDPDSPPILVDSSDKLFRLVNLALPHLLPDGSNASTEKSLRWGVTAYLLTDRGLALVGDQTENGGKTEIIRLDNARLSTLPSHIKPLVTSISRHPVPLQTRMYEGVSGGVEPNEPPDVAMEREIFEELGVQIGPYQMRKLQIAPWFVDQLRHGEHTSFLVTPYLVWLSCEQQWQIGQDRDLTVIPLDEIEAFLEKHVPANMIRPITLAQLLHILITPNVFQDAVKASA